MKYLIVPAHSDPFYSEWFSIENNYTHGMMVFDLQEELYLDGISNHWYEITHNHL